MQNEKIYKCLRWLMTVVLMYGLRSSCLWFIYRICSRSTNNCKLLVSERKFNKVWVLMKLHFRLKIKVIFALTNQSSFLGWRFDESFSTRRSLHSRFSKFTLVIGRSGGQKYREKAIWPYWWADDSVGKVLFTNELIEACWDKNAFVYIKLAVLCIPLRTEIRCFIVSATHIRF